MDPPISFVHGFLQARILEWVAILFSRGVFQTEGLNLGLPALKANSLPSEIPGKPHKFMSDGKFHNI